MLVPPQPAEEAEGIFSTDNELASSLKGTFLSISSIYREPHMGGAQRGQVAADQEV